MTVEAPGSGSDRTTFTNPLAGMGVGAGPVSTEVIPVAGPVAPDVVIPVPSIEVTTAVPKSVGRAKRASRVVTDGIRRTIVPRTPDAATTAAPVVEPTRSRGRKLSSRIPLPPTVVPTDPAGFKAHIEAHGADGSPTTVSDPALAESARRVRILMGGTDPAPLTTPTALVVKEPYDPRNLGRLGHEAARDLADVTKPLIDEAARLKQEAAALVAEGRPAERKLKAAGAKEKQIADTEYATLSAQEAAAETTRMDVDEARYLADLEAPLRNAAGEATTKLGNVQVARKLIEKANAVSVEGRAHYEKVSTFLANQMIAVTSMLEAGQGINSTAELNDIREADKMSAVTQLKTLLQCPDVPIYSQEADNGHSIELVYPSNRPGSEKLLTVERWDKITGKLMSINTLVYKGEPRRAVVDRLRPWRDPEIKLGQDVENRFVQLRSVDANWRNQAGNSTRNEPALMTNMAAAGVSSQVREQYNPAKKPKRQKQASLFEGWFRPRKAAKASTTTRR